MNASEARKYLKWYRHFRAHMQDPETARDSALRWMIQRPDDIRAHKARYTWNRTETPTEPQNAPQKPAQPQPAPRKRRRSYTDPTTPDQPTLF